MSNKETGIQFLRGNDRDGILRVKLDGTYIGHINQCGDFVGLNIEELCIDGANLRRIADKCDEVKKAIYGISLE